MLFCSALAIPDLLVRVLNLAGDVENVESIIGVVGARLWQQTEYTDTAGTKREVSLLTRTCMHE